MESLKYVICFPFNDKYAKKCLEIEEVIEKILDLEGRKLTLLAKGTDSIVLSLDEKYALKVVRLDREISLLKEGMSLYILERNFKKTGIKIAPELYSFSKYHVLMERINGISISDFIFSASEDELKDALRSLLIYSLKLDSIRLSHNELSRPYHHVFFIKNREKITPIFLDFGSSTINGNNSNFLQISSALFLSKSRINERITKSFKIDEITQNKLRELLILYKNCFKKRCMQEEIEKVIEKILNIIFRQES
ncbi:hypothetical protein IOK49_00210 [Fervidicoccus fontis]|uniref:Serine/threonine protein kinase n=1 Tax=Fervidicoccus fontis TaxID=683846 RepID=A0A843A6V2_9CREN|nr:hypothetical protein [Fervidicoccus fontis]MBE9390513.1 hypothetical protein [Fervidicoccus fontis]